MNNGLFDKLTAVEIKTDSRINDADRQFCEIHQQAYREAKRGLVEMHDLWSSISERQEELLSPVEESRYSLDKYISISHLSGTDFISKIEDLPSSFIYSLVSYFNSTYKVSIDDDEIAKALLPKKPDRGMWDPEHKVEIEYHKKLRSLELTYKTVLDQIFIQLGGQSFTQRALDELKENCHSAAWNTYSGKQLFELKNDTIRFTSYFCRCENWGVKDHWSLCDDMKHILRGMAHFETGVIGKYPSLIAHLLGYGDKDYSIFAFEDCSQIKQLKMYKNNRVDVKFSSKKSAEQFITDYLGSVC